MSSPGGREVGRVSVRVVPNSSSFARLLKRQLKDDLAKDLKVDVPVNFIVDQDKFRSSIEKLKVPTIRVPVEIQLPGTTKRATVPVDVDTAPASDGIDEFIRTVQAKQARINAKVELDRAAAADLQRTMDNLSLQAQVQVDKDKFDAQLAELEANFERISRLQVQIDMDRSRFDRGLDGVRSGVEGITNLVKTIGGAFSTVFSGIGSAISAGFARVGVDLGGVSDVLGNIAKKTGAVVGSLIGAVNVVASFADAIFFASVKATGLAAAGAAVSAAWGLVSTAIAAVPAAIGLLGAPIGVVALGMDGIKKAAEVLKPTFERLKESISATFEKGLTPILRSLKDDLAGLTAPLNNIAESLVGLAERTANWINVAGGAATITTTLNNIADAIDQVNLVPLLDGFIRLAGNQAALSALARVIEEVGVGLQQIADNPALDGAFKGLEEVLASLTRAFFALVNNGIELFNGAWPGLKQGLDGITAFFDKFNWQSLGESVGGVFRGIGEALKSIPQSTVDAIVKGFQDLAVIFQSPQFAEGIRGFALALPALLQGLKLGVAAFSEFGKAIGTFVLPQLAVLGQAMELLGKVIPGSFGTALEEAGKSLKDLSLTGIAEMNKLPPVAVDAASGILTAFQPLPNQVGAVGQAIPPALITPLQGLPGVVGPLAGAAALALTTGLAPMPGQAGATAQQTTTAFGQGLSPLDQILQQEVGPLAGQLGTLLTPLEQEALKNAKRIPIGFGSGLGDMSPTLARELGLLPPVATTGVGEVGTAVTTGLEGIAAGVPTSLVPLQTAFTTGFAAIAAAVPATFTLPFQTALTTAFSTISAAIPTIFTLPLQTALTAGVAAITAAFPTIFTTPFQTALTTAFAELNAQLPTIFTTPFQTALTTAFTTIFAAFPTIFTLPFQTAITTALQAVVALFPTIFTLPFQTALTTSLTAISALIPTLFVPITTAFTTAFAAIVALIAPNLDTPMTQAVTTAMTNFNNAVTTGFNTVVQSVIAGANRIIGVLNQLPPAGQQTGRNLITAMSNAILAGRSQLINAIAQVIAQAIAAATAMLQINSPSKVFQKIGASIPEGLALAITEGKAEVVDSMRGLTASAISAGQGIGDAVAASMGFDGAALQSSVNASGTLNAAPAPPVYVFIGDEPFGGMVEARIGSYDARLRAAKSVR